MGVRGGGGTLIFSYIRRFWLFLGVQNFEFQYLGGGGIQKTVWIFIYFFFLGGGGGVITKLDYI